MSGKVWLVGAGPSDIGLFTLKGKEVLQKADAVVYDALAGRDILTLIPPGAQRFDVGKKAGNHPVPQHEINQLLLRLAMEGKRVVRLKGGDPFLFGRGGEELELLTANGIPFEIVPGVTSAIAVPAYQGIPVTHRDYCSSVHIITGHAKAGAETAIDFASLVKLNGTLIFLMGVAALPTICGGLLQGGIDPDTPAAVLERGTTSRQRRILSTVKELPEAAAKAKVRTPAIIVVGKVCQLAQRFHWAEDRRLDGVHVLVTRPRERAAALTEKLRELGAQVTELPSILTRAIPKNQELSDVLGQLSCYTWLVFTSPAGVQTFLQELKARRMDIRALTSVKLAAIGPATQKELENTGLFCDFVPEQYSGAELGKGLVQQINSQDRILLLRAKESSKELNQILEEAGAVYDEVPLYETVYEHPQAEEVKKQLQDGQIDYVTFTSASTVKGFVNTIPGLNYSQLSAVCIGQQTAAEAQKYGFRCTVSKSATIDSMVETLEMLSAQGKEDVSWI